MKIQFLGGASTVTGSKFLISYHTKKILIDCGLFHGLKALRLKNWAPRAPKKVFITHGEKHASEHLRLKIKEKFGWECHIPELESEISLI
jgi:metallo-beta-lactamase family protein